MTCSWSVTHKHPCFRFLPWSSFLCFWFARRSRSATGNFGRLGRGPTTMRPLADLRLLWAIRTPRRMGLRRFLAIRTHRYRAYARRVHSISTCVYFLLQLSFIYFIYSSSDSFQLDSPPPAVACSKLSFSLFSSCVQVHLEDELNVTIPIVLWISLQHSLPLAILHAYLSWAYGCILLAQQRSFLLPVVHVLFFSWWFIFSFFIQFWCVCRFAHFPAATVTSLAPSSSRHSVGGIRTESFIPRVTWTWPLQYL